MGYHLDFDVLGLDFLERRLMEEDLIPSQAPLREGLAEKLAALGGAGVKTLSDLEGRLKKDAAVEALSRDSGVGEPYLKLLGRVLRGYRPKPAALSEYPRVDPQLPGALKVHGIADSRTLWTAAHRSEGRKALAAAVGVPLPALTELVLLSDLSRIQWVSPLFAVLLGAAGFKSVAAVAGAGAEDLAVKAAAANRAEGLFKGTVGERDMGRLVYLARRLPLELEL